QDDSGAYACVTPGGGNHHVELDIKEVMCEPIIPPKGLLVDPPDESIMNTKVTFSCESRTSLVGPEHAYCLPSGKWSDSFPYCEKVKCSPPTAPMNGIIAGEGPYHSGDMVQITCRPNFMMDGQPFIVCQQDGKWSLVIPKCVPACTYPGTIISGTMSSVKFFYAIGETIDYDCSEGFMLHGEKTIRCVDGRKWSDKVPSCLPRN
ncbi:unnamed protein product, partial [Meganyctiphanes norvegica]